MERRIFRRGKLCAQIGVIVGGIALILQTFSVWAQAIPQPDLNTLQKQQRQLKQRRQEDFRDYLEKLKRPGKGKGGIERIPQPTQPQIPKSDRCFNIHQVTFKGTTLLSEDEQADIARPFLGQCLTLEKINQIVRETTNLYVEKGFVTARASLPQQDIADGSLEILIMEGHVEGFNLKGATEPEKRQLATAFPGLEGELLNLQDLEQGLDQMNRLASNNATMKMAPGQKHGGSIVAIENQKAKPWRASFGLDNSGYKSTGNRQRTMTLGYDNIFNLNDTYSLTLSQDDHADDLGKGGNEASGYFSIPYGYWTLTYSGSYSDSLSTLIGTSATYRSESTSRTHQVDIDRVLHRNAEGKTTATLGLKTYSTKSYIDGIELDASSYRFTSLSGALSHTRKLLGGSVTLDGTYTRGVRMLGADKDAPFVEKGTARAQFTKVETGLSYYRPFQIVGQNFSYNGSLTAQWSPHTLPSTEQLSLGSESTVRGFKESTTSGDIGGYIQQEIAWTLPQTGVAMLDDVIGTVQAYGAFDIGAIRKDVKDTEGKGVLSGWAAGIRTSGGYLVVDLAFARAIRAPAHVHKRGYETYLSAALSF